MPVLAGGGVKVFAKNDIRLRGFTSVSTVSYEVLPPPTEARESVDDCNHCLDSGYRAVYRLLCGGGYGTFTLWQAVLVAEPEMAPTSRPGGGASSPVFGEGGTGEVVFKYSHKWEVMHNGSVNSPTLVFGLVMSPPSQSPPGSTCAFFLQGIDKDMRGFCADNIANPSVAAVVSASSPVKALNFLTGPNYRGVTNVLAGSDDGMTLFAGEDELIVYR